MAHKQQIDFCLGVKQKFPEYFEGSLVLDVGSLDINGNNQYLFKDCYYLGIDLLPGKNVDIVIEGHNLALPDETFDVIISTECFEHDKYYKKTLKNIIRLLKPGGLFIFTCATTGRPEHGTLSTTPHDAPFLNNFDDWGNYYKNLTVKNVREVVDIKSIFQKSKFSTNPESHDLYFWGIKSGTFSHRDDYSFSLRVINREEKLKKLRETLAARETEINQAHESINVLTEHTYQAYLDRDSALTSRDTANIERDAAVTERDAALASRDTANIERDAALTNRDAAITGRDSAVAERDAALIERDELGQALQSSNVEINLMLNSRSWRITKPLRWFRRKFGEFHMMVRRFVSITLRTIWNKTPITLEQKRHFKNTIFKAFPFIFSHTATYHTWKSYQRSCRQVNRVIDNGNVDKEINYNIDALEYKPLISILIPVFNVEVSYLLEAIDSVKDQYYERWEICICDDGSTSKELFHALNDIEKSDKRINVISLEMNQGISAATNAVLNIASGDYIALLDNDDLLTKDALFIFVKRLNKNNAIDVIYSDQDKITADGIIFESFYKPDWSPEYLRGVMYIGHLLMVRTEVAKKVGGFNSKYDKIQDFEFMLRVSEYTHNIEHIPKILYHWRAIEGSLSYGVDEKSDISFLQVKAVNEHLKRCGIPATAEPHKKYPHRVTLLPVSRDTWPLVSIIIPTRDAPEHIGRCLDSIYSQTTYNNFEVIIVDNGTTDMTALKHIEKYPVRVVPYFSHFNFSEANNLGADKAKGEYLILLNNDTKVITKDWIENLLLYAEQPDIGAVGPLLIYPDNTVQHAGVVLGFRGTADHVMRGFPSESDGYAGSLSCSREVSSVTGACMMISRKRYIKLGGLVNYYNTHYQDVDLCLRLAEKGLRIVFASQVRLIHHENVSRKSFYDLMDRALLLDTWRKSIDNMDPYYNSNFSLSHTDYTLAT